jgi:hypothetical protein
LSAWVAKNSCWMTIKFYFPYFSIFTYLLYIFSPCFFILLSKQTRFPVEASVFIRTQSHHTDWPASVSPFSSNWSVTACISFIILCTLFTPPPLIFP